MSKIKNYPVAESEEGGDSPDPKETRRTNAFGQVIEKLIIDPDYLKMKTAPQLFLFAYLRTKKYSEAAVEAGYSVKGAKKQLERMMAKPDWRALYDKYSGMEALLCSDEKEEMLDELRAIQKKADQEGKYEAAISAIKQRSKMRGFDAPIETKGSGKYVVQSWSKFIEETKTKHNL